MIYCYSCKHSGKHVTLPPTVVINKYGNKKNVPERTLTECLSDESEYHRQLVRVDFVCHCWDEKTLNGIV